MNKVTEWYPPQTKPVRKGVYQVCEEGYDWVAYQYWNGCQWSAFEYSAEQSYRFRMERSFFQGHKWRGLTAPK